MRRIIKIISIATYFIGGYCRFRWSLAFVRFANKEIYRYGRVGRYISKQLSMRFDPNDIRKKINIKFSPLYCSSVGIFGEKYRLNINEHIGWNIYLRGYFDIVPPSLAAAVYKYFNLKGVFIDIGANIGSSSIGLAKKYGVEVVGIDANTTVSGELSTNVSLNHPIKYSAINVAVTSPQHAQAEDFAEIFSSDGNIAATSLVQGWNPSKNRNMRTGLVKLVTADSVLDFLKIQEVALIKIDVEGFESNTIRGLARTLTRFHPIVLFEWRPDIHNTSSSIVPSIKDLFPEDYIFFGVDAHLKSKNIFIIEIAGFNESGIYEDVLAISKKTVKDNKKVSEFIQNKFIKVEL